MELNGLALIAIKIEKMKSEGKIVKADAKELMDLVDLFDRYLTAFNHDKSVNWHEVRDKPYDYLTQGELIEKLCKFKKMSDKELGQLLVLSPRESSTYMVGWRFMTGEGVYHVEIFKAIKELQNAPAKTIRHKLECELLSNELKNRCDDWKGERGDGPVKTVQGT